MVKIAIKCKTVCLPILSYNTIMHLPFGNKFYKKKANTKNIVYKIKNT